MKPIIPLATLLVGVAIGWFARPSLDKPTDTAAAKPTTSTETRPAQTTATVATNTTSSGRPADPDNDDAKSKASDAQMKKAQEQMAKRLVDVHRKKFEAKLSKLTAELNLTPQQQEKIRASMEERMAVLGTLFTHDPKASPEEQGKRMDEMAAVMKSDGFDEATADLLTPDQEEKYAGVKAKERAGRIEARTLKGLGSLSTVLELTPDQRESIYDVLSSEAETREDNQKFGMMSAFSETMGVQIDDELGIQDLMQEQMEAQMENAKNGSVIDFQKTIRDTIKQRTEEKLEALRPHLTEAQVEQYRQHLETKAAGAMNMFGGGGDPDDE
jgi:Spy/CpxP family protein refolding chaperone